MSGNSLPPLPLKSRLALTPASKPQFSTQVQLRNGESIAVVDPKATRAMVALMDMNAAIGGAASHYGGPAAFAELMSATHGLMFYYSKKYKQEWYESFNFVNDAGHTENGLYSLKANYGFAGLTLGELRKFRSVESRLTGHGEAHLFPEGVLISNGPLGSGVPQAQGLAVADALSGKKRVTIAAISDGGAMEGEAKESFAAIPGLAKSGKLAPFILIISDNNTKLSGRMEPDCFSMLPTFAALDDLGWKVLKVDDGHNLQACVATIEEAIQQVSADPTVPVAIHAKTIKGKGTKKTESSATGAHGFPLKKVAELSEFLTEIYEGTAVPAEFLNWVEDLKTTEASAKSTGTSQPTEKVQAGISRAMIAKRREGLPIVSVSADLQGSTGVADFQKEFPDAFIDVGVAEANMVSTGIGLSIQGYIPVVDTFAQFGVTKGALPLIMSGLSHGPVVGVFSHTSFQSAADGASHQALSFFAQVSSIPHVEVYALTCSGEAESLLNQAFDSFAQERKAGRVPPSRIFFLGRENFPKQYTTDAKYKLSQAQIISDNVQNSARAVTLVAAGSLLPEAVEASRRLAEKGIGSIVINPSVINRPDVQAISAAIKKTGGRLVTVEEHRVVGGMGAMLTHALLLNEAFRGEKLQVRSLGVKDEFGHSAYMAQELYQKFGLDAVGILNAVDSLF